MLDYLGIFKELNKRKIKYIVVGGMAINLYGIPRMTYDLDFILLLENNNIKKFITLMKKWGFKPKVPVNIMDFSNKDKRNDWIKNKNMKAFNLVNLNWGIAEIDIIIDSPVNYEKAYKNIKYISLRNTQIPTIGIDDLIKMKHKTGRKQDLADVKTLMKLKR
ncbi:MAG: DUF6036 family nucleotidyltransferase [Candidatus Omnitrophota bacterium]